MKRKVVGIALFCLLLLAAIFAGYWDMLSTERLRLAGDRTSAATGDPTGLVDSAPAPAPAASTAPTEARAVADAGPPAQGRAASTEAPALATGTRSGVSGAPEAGDAAAAPEASRTPATVPPASPPVAPGATPQTAASGSPPADGPSATSAGTAVPSEPSFDILRVEPDGSTVVAGKAAPGATVRLTDGRSTIGTETAGGNGDFVVVLEKPLPAGDHQIQIEATDKAGASTRSKETAVVSVPERGREGELLAMVETPDAPSRLISIPAAPASTAATAPVEAPATAASEPAATAPAVEPPAGTAAPTPASTPTPAPAQTAAPTPGGSEVAALGSSSDAPAAPPRADAVPSAGAAPFAVEAVEIEGETIYVAGRAPAGPSVRIYVDNRFLAEDGQRSTGRFLVTARSTVAPGEHLVRADQIAADGTVVARVEVPFFKPEGRAMSAVSQTEGGPSAQTAEAAPSPDAAPRPAPATPPAANAPAPSPVAGPALAETPAAPSRAAASDGGSPAEETGSVDSGGTPAPAASAETPPTRGGPPPAAPTTETAAAAAIAERLAAAEAPVAAPAAPVPDPAATAPAVSPSAAGGAGPSTAPSSSPVAAMPEAAPALGTGRTPGGSTGPSLDARRAGADAGIAATRQTPLQGVSARVIIRRGDTLWRISRETYGAGARYTVIYLANGDQIRNPDRIYPGQVFRMPDGQGSGPTAVE